MQRLSVVMSVIYDQILELRQRHLRLGGRLAEEARYLLRDGHLLVDDVLRHLHRLHLELVQRLGLRLLLRYVVEEGYREPLLGNVDDRLVDYYAAVLVADLMQRYVALLGDGEREVHGSRKSSMRRPVISLRVTFSRCCAARLHSLTCRSRSTAMI